MKPYPAYKASGVEWLGDVPEGWEVAALKWIADLQSGNSITSEDIDETGDFPVYGGNGLRGYTKQYTHEGLFALIGRQGALCGNVNYARGRFWASEHAIVVGQRKEFFPIWLGELLRAMNLNQYSTSAAQPGLAVEFLRELRIPVPPLPEQQAIAAFLDREVAKIDGLVAEQRRLIALLAEKRQAVISHAVTCGLNPTTPLKPSGIDWLGDIPEGWAVAAFKRVTERVVVGIAEAATYAYVDVGVPILRSMNVRAGKLVGDLLYVDHAYSAERETKLIRAGDLITVRTGHAGVTAVIPQELDACQCFTMLVSTMRSGMVPEYFCYWMNSSISVQYFSVEAWGSAQPNISVPILQATPVLIPPEREQRAIVAFVDEQLIGFDALTETASTAITLLQERRAELISAAVTGKIDVRNLAPKDIFPVAEPA